MTEQKPVYNVPKYPLLSVLGRDGYERVGAVYDLSLIGIKDDVRLKFHLGDIGEFDLDWLLFHCPGLFKFELLGREATLLADCVDIERVDGMPSIDLRVRSVRGELVGL